MKDCYFLSYLIIPLCEGREANEEIMNILMTHANRNRHIKNRNRKRHLLLVCLENNVIMM